MVSRYGVKIRKLESKIKAIQHKKHPCPSCGKTKVHRISTGIWQCTSCKKTFAGGAYAPRTGISLSAQSTAAREAKNK